MFNLDEAIANWRRQMAAGGIKTPEALDELESHLRDDMEQQRRSGVRAQQAFETAVGRIGQVDALNAEFEKTGETTARQQMKRIAILAALFGMVLGIGLVLPVLGRWSRTGALYLGPLLAGVALIIVGGSAAFYGIRSYRARGRMLINIGIIAAGTFYVVPFVLALFRAQETDLMGWIFCGFLAVAATLFFGSCLYFNRSAVRPIHES